MTGGISHQERIFFSPFSGLKVQVLSVKGWASLEGVWGAYRQICMHLKSPALHVGVMFPSNVDVSEVIYMINKVITENVSCSRGRGLATLLWCPGRVIWPPQTGIMKFKNPICRISSYLAA